jgi:hypothetical protein
MKSEGLDKRVIECDLTIKLLYYLTLDCFRPQLSNNDRRHFAQGGYYALQDYAASNWRRHLEHLIMHAAPLFEEDEADYTRKLATALGRFLYFYKEIKRSDQDPEDSNTWGGSLQVPYSSSSQSRDSFTHSSPAVSSRSTSASSGSATHYQSPSASYRTSFSRGHASRSPSSSRGGTRPHNPDNDPIDFCEPYRHIAELYRYLVPLWTHVYQHQRQTDSKQREKISITQLRASVEASRTAIQSLALPDGNNTGYPTLQIPTLHTLYGPRLYKCDRVVCDYFFEGFATQDELEKHSQRHDRPFHCPVRNCSLAPLGFTTKKDCEHHVKLCHTEDEGPSAAFATGKGPESQEDNEKRAMYACTFEFCDKRYTRQVALDAHLDNHNGTRRFVCPICERAFTRQSDRTRHEKIHVKGK